jgi:hypothetical protein
LTADVAVVGGFGGACVARRGLAPWQQAAYAAGEKGVFKCESCSGCFANGVRPYCESCRHTHAKRNARAAEASNVREEAAATGGFARVGGVTKGASAAPLGSTAAASSPEAAAAAAVDASAATRDFDGSQFVKLKVRKGFFGQFLCR